MRLHTLALVSLVGLVGCGDSAEGGGSASAKPSAAPPKPTAVVTASASASAGPVALPGTPLKDTLKDVKSIMAIGNASAPMGVMVSDKKDVDAILAAIGTDQPVKKFFESKCVTPTNMDFQSADKKSLGAIGFCDTDDKLATGRFDAKDSNISKAELAIKDPAALKAALKKAKAIK